MGLETNNHSVFKMKYQLYLMTNRLSPIINKDRSERLNEIFQDISPRYNIFLSEWDYSEDRIKITLSAHPNTELSKFINAYKSASSRLIKKEYPHLVDRLPKGQFWSRTFCLITLEHGLDEDEIRSFIEKQG